MDLKAINENANLEKICRMIVEVAENGDLDELDLREWGIDSIEKNKKIIEILKRDYAVENEMEISCGYIEFK